MLMITANASGQPTGHPTTMQLGPALQRPKAYKQPKRISIVCCEILTIRSITSWPQRHSSTRLNMPSLPLLAKPCPETHSKQSQTNHAPQPQTQTNVRPLTAQTQRLSCLDEHREVLIPTREELGYSHMFDLRNRRTPNDNMEQLGRMRANTSHGDLYMLSPPPQVWMSTAVQLSTRISQPSSTNSLLHGRPAFQP